MAKPSRKKAATSSRRKAPARKAAPKPAPAPETVEELKQEIAKFDHDGDGHAGGSLPHTQEESVQEQEPATEPVEEVAEPKAEEPEFPSPVARLTQAVSLGPVKCRMRQVAVDDVLGLLSPSGLRRIEAEKTTGSFETLCKRLLATDGRGTPIVFEASNTVGAEPTILHGYAELAAAQVCGVPTATVILVPPGGAAEAQSYIVEMVRQQNAKEQPSEDDELFYRVHAED
jgi:hypothetical protein